MKTKIFAFHANEVRDSCWILVQNEDGTLFVEQVAKYADETKHRRLVTINDFLQEGGPPPRVLQALVDRMFVDDERQIT
jgi:hypothetical protein